MPIPIIAAIASKVGLAKAAAGAAVKAGAAKAAAGAVVKGAATKAVAKTAVTSVAQKAVKGAASEGLTSIKPIAPKLVSEGQKQFRLSKLGESEMAKLSARLGPTAKASNGGLKEMASKMLETNQQKEQKEPQWSQREGIINAITPNGLPAQAPGAYQNEINLLKQ